MRDKLETRAGLDALTVEIELTLTSIIQGVALYFLTENARLALSLSALTSWLYVANGLLIILVFWSRSVLHTLTLIRWPLEFVHNFIYVACTLAEAVLFTRLGNPRAWFTISVVYAIAVWVLFVVDLRMIEARCRDSNGEFGIRLCAAVKRDQWLNIVWLVPGLCFMNAVFASAIWKWPSLFIDRGAHAFLVTISLCALASYLAYVVRLYNRLAPLITATRGEWYVQS